MDTTYIIREAILVLHPGVIGLIHAEHGNPDGERAQEIVWLLRGMLAAIEQATIA